MQIEGTVTKVLNEVSGEGKSGTWRKREFILETDGKYPKEICVTVWGDMVDDVADITGQTITAEIDISRVHRRAGGNARPRHGPGPTDLRNASSSCAQWGALSADGKRITPGRG